MGDATSIQGKGGSNTLTGPALASNQSNVWTINGKNAGNLNGASWTFTDIQNLTGGSVNDTFAFLPGGSISGNLTGEAPTNTVDYSGYGSPVTVNLPPTKATGIGGTWANIQGFVGTGTADTLVAANAINTWSISGTNAGTVDGISFAGFPNLTGGNTNDTFAFLPGGSIAGNLNGGAPINTLDYSDYGSAVTVNLETKTATGIGGTWASIQAFIGTDTTDTLVGANANSTWSITGSDAGTVAGYSFMGFPNLTGGPATTPSPSQRGPLAVRNRHRRRRHQHSRRVRLRQPRHGRSANNDCDCGSVPGPTSRSSKAPTRPTRSSRQMTPPTPGPSRARTAGRWTACPSPGSPT